MEGTLYSQAGDSTAYREIARRRRGDVALATRLPVDCGRAAGDSSGLLAVTDLVVVGEGNGRCRCLIGVPMWIGRWVDGVEWCCAQWSPVSSTGMISARCTIIECVCPLILV